MRNPDPIKLPRNVMSAATASALTVVRVAHGQPKPSDEDLQAAITRDRVRLHLPPQNHLHDLAVAGPYAITVDGQELDEYVIWER
jgi:hypothetical protein